MLWTFQQNVFSVVFNFVGAGLLNHFLLFGSLDSGFQIPTVLAPAARRAQLKPAILLTVLIAKGPIRGSINPGKTCS